MTETTGVGVHVEDDEDGRISDDVDIVVGVVGTYVVVGVVGLTDGEDGIDGEIVTGTGTDTVEGCCDGVCDDKSVGETDVIGIVNARYLQNRYGREEDHRSHM